MEPDGCICPTESYTCRADLVTVIEIDNINLTGPFFYVAGFSRRPEVVREGLRVSFSEVKVGDTLFNLTAQLFVVDTQNWNGSNFTCGTRGRDNKDISICVTGKLLIVRDGYLLK